MAEPQQVDRDFPAYASTYRLATARLLEASGAAGPAREVVVRALVASWRSHVELCLEHLLQVGRVVLDQGWQAEPRAVPLEGLWAEALQLLAALGGRPQHELDAAQRAVSQLGQGGDGARAQGEGPLPDGWRVAEMHAAMTFLSELLEREVRRLRRLEARRAEALTWMA